MALEVAPTLWSPNGREVHWHKKVVTLTTAPAQILDPDPLRVHVLLVNNSPTRARLSIADPPTATDHIPLFENGGSVIFTRVEDGNWMTMPFIADVAAGSATILVIEGSAR